MISVFVILPVDGGRTSLKNTVIFIMSKFENKTQPITNTNKIALTMTVRLHRQRPEPRNSKRIMLIDLRTVCD
jgi:hypothetical protein